MKQFGLETKLFHFHGILKHIGQGGGSSELPEPPLDPPLALPTESLKGSLILLQRRLTNLCRMYFPIRINWKSPFPILGLLGGIFHFYSNSNRTFCK